MIASLVRDLEGAEWSYENVARELDDLGMDAAEGFEQESAPEPGPEDEVRDDEIRRAAEELENDEG